MTENSRYISSECCDVLEEIVALFSSDTFISLDCVLEDNSTEPEFSANTVYNRLYKVYMVRKLLYHEELYSTMEDFLQANGYSKSDIRLLAKKRREESARHNRLKTQGRESNIDDT